MKYKINRKRAERITRKAHRGDTKDSGGWAPLQHTLRSLAEPPARDGPKDEEKSRIGKGIRVDEVTQKNACDANLRC